MTEPVLYVVATPLGNLADMTQRAREVLRDVPWVAAEDTRHTRVLLEACGSRARLLSAHQHNENAAAEEILRLLHEGESVALVSDAGTPAISDPGARVVARVREAGFRVIPLPGPCAAVTALSAAGVAETPFLFFGFLPAKAKARQTCLESLAHLPYTLVFYEAPHRILATVETMRATLGAERQAVLARELTKVFEEIFQGTLQEACAWLTADAHHQRGEFVVIVAGAQARAAESDHERLLRILLKEDLSVRQSVKIVGALTGAPKNEVYASALKLAASRAETEEKENE